MTRRLLPILYYHHVGERRESGGHRRLWISNERFGQQMNYLAREGYHCSSLRDVEALLQGNERARQRAVVLTFDDGYKNFHEFAYPLLRQYGFGATVFVVTGQVGGLSRWDAGWETPLMGWTELRDLTAHGIEIGSHTASHPRLTQLQPAEAKRELETSRAVLEQNLGVPAGTLAYPFGDWNAAVEELARQTGYHLACRITRGNRHSPAELHRLNRVPVDEFTTLPRFRRKLSPLYDFTCRMRRWGRTLRHRRPT
jgi:peptidoglycan/xylan/chitin deacetylase (PgdA/CDA1 family)